MYLKEEIMKKITVFLVILSVMFITASGHAQVKKGAFNISPTIGMYTFEGNEDTNRPMIYGLRLGYNFTKYFGLEGFVHYGQPEINSITPKERYDFTGYGVEGIINIFPDQKLVPFLAVGVGGVHYSSCYDFTTENKHDKIAADWGYGLKYYLSDNFALRFDIRHVIPFDSSHNNMFYALGLNFAFGGAKKTAVAEGTAVQQAASPVTVEETKPQAAAPVVVEEKKAKAAAPVIVQESRPQAAAPVVVEEAKRQAAMSKEIAEKGRTTLCVLFDTGKSVIKKESYKEIDDFAAVMKNNPGYKVVIEGHTDNVGGAALNKKLSHKRAEAVKKYLVTKGGIDAKRLTAKGYGKDKPVASNKTKEGREKNRRVEAALKNIKKK